MEGFLYKKGTGSSAIGRKNWKRRWFLLEGAMLSYYESFNHDTGEPVDLKGTVQMTSLLVEPVMHKDYRFTFVAKDEQLQKTVLFLRADDKNSMDLWIRTLLFAAKIDVNPLSREKLLSQSYELLELNPSDPQSLQQVNKAYRLLCLKHHPDKGGSTAVFTSIKSAYQLVAAKLERDEEHFRYNVATFEVVLKKGAAGEGIGLVVMEDEQKQELTVKSLSSKICIVSMKGLVNDTIRIGDRVMKVGRVDVSSIPLIRLGQKLSDAVVPPETTVTLTLSRRIPKDGVDEDKDDYDENEDEEFIAAHLRTERRGLAPIAEAEEEQFDGDEQEQEEQFPSSHSAAESQRPKQSHRRSILVDIDESYRHYDEKEDDLDEDLDESYIDDFHIGDSTAEERNNVAIAEDDCDEQSEDQCEDQREVDEQKSSTDELEGTHSKQKKADNVAPKSYALSITEEESKELQSTMLDVFAMVTGGRPWPSTAADGVSSDTEAYVGDDKKDLKAKRIAVAALNLLGPLSQELRLKWSAQDVSPIDRLQLLEETLGHLVDASTVASVAGTDTVVDSTSIQSTNAAAKVSPIRLPSPTASLKRGESAQAMVSPPQKTISSDIISPSVKQPLSSDRKTPSYMKPTKSKNFHNSTVELSPM